MGDRVIALITLGIAAIYFYGIRQIEVPSIDDVLGPRTFPTLIGLGLVIAAGLLFYEPYAARRRVTSAPDKIEVEDAPHRYRALFGIVIATGAYFMAFEPVGCLVATTVYLVALTIVFNPQNKTMAVLSSVVFVSGSYFAFKELLGVRLPGGILSF